MNGGLESCMMYDGLVALWGQGIAMAQRINE